MSSSLNWQGMRTFGDTVGTVWVLLDFHTLKMENIAKCDPPQDFNAKGESTRTTSLKTKEFILTRFSTLAILPRSLAISFVRLAHA